AVQLELPVVRLHAVGIEIGDLPEMENAQVIEPLLELGGDVVNPLEIVGLAPRRLDTLEDKRQLLLRRSDGLAAVDAGSRLGPLDAVDGRPRRKIAVERDGTAGVVVAGDREVNAIRIAV